MAWAVVVLLRQCDDQFKIGLPWMEVHITPLVTGWAVSPECKCRRVGLPLMSLKVCGLGSQPIAWRNAKGWSLWPLLRLKNDQVNYGELTRVATCGIRAGCQYLSYHFGKWMAMKHVGYDGEREVFKRLLLRPLLVPFNLVCPLSSSSKCSKR